MGKREDGRETRQRLLTAALELFSRNGYNRVTVADICKKARANQAAVNYYFRDKASLYAESWQYAVEQLPDFFSTVPEDTDPEDLLGKYIRELLHKFLSNDEKGSFIRLYLMELLQPTGLIQGTWHEIVQPRRQKLQEVIRCIMGRAPDPETLLFCELSIVSQCRNLLTIKPDDMEFFLGHAMDQETIDRLAEHITTFSLAGIKALTANGPKDKGVTVPL